jgi:phosphonate transport system ATP-binding protein
VEKRRRRRHRDGSNQSEVSASRNNTADQYRLQEVGKVFGRRQVALGGVDLTIRRGEKVALIGPSGAGKTTLFRLLNLTLRPTSGSLWLDGADVLELHGSKLREARRKIGTIYQQHNLVPRLKVVHNVLCGWLGQWSTARSLWSLARPADIEQAYHALKQVGIQEKIFSRTDELSGGQQQRVAVARVLLQNPEVILADEPVSSVDPSLASSIVKLLVDVSEGTHKTLLVNLHSVDLALEFFPRIVGLRNGTTVFDLRPEQITEGLLEDLYSGRVPESERAEMNDEEPGPPILQ